MATESAIAVDKPSLTFNDFTREQKLVFLSLSLGYISMFCAGTLMAPFFPPEAAKHGVTSSAVGVLYSSSSVTAILASLFLGPLIAGLGPKIVIIAGIALNGIFTLLFGCLEYVESYEWFVAGCFICFGISSIGATAIYTATLTYAAKMFPDHMSFVVGTTETYISVAEIIALVSGGFIHDLGGFKLPFIFFSSLHLLVIPLDLYLLPNDLPEEKVPENQEMETMETNGKGVSMQMEKLNLKSENVTESAPPTPVATKSIRLWHLAKIPRTVLMALSILVTGICWSFLSTTLEPHLAPLNLTKTETNLIFLLMSVVYGLACPLWGWYADRMKKTWLLMVAGLVLSGIFYCILGPPSFLPLENTVWLNIVCLSVITTALAAAGIPPCESALLYTIEAGYEDNLATYAVVSSLISIMYSAGGGIGSFAGGFMLDYLGYATSAAIFGAVIFFWGIIVFSYFIFGHNVATPRDKNPKTKQTAREIATP